MDHSSEEPCSYLFPQAKIEAMAEDIQPLLAEVCDSGLLKEVESSSKNLTGATEDLRKLQSFLLTPENSERIRKSIYSFLFTLKNIENISSDISGLTGDEAIRRNLKLLIRSNNAISDEAIRRNLKLLIRSNNAISELCSFWFFSNR